MEFFTEIGKMFMSHSKFIFGVIINIAVIYIFCKIMDVFVVRLENRLRQMNPDTPLLNLMPVLSRIIKAIVVFLLLAGLLQSFGYNVTSLLAGFGITGLAVGFAAKESIGNVFGSFELLADKVYKIGEYISFNGYEGTVENVNLRSTTIRTPQGFRVNVPNNILANEEITNLSQAKQRRLDITIDIEYGTSNEKIDRACEILREIAGDTESIDKNYIAFVDEMAASAIVIRLVAYTSRIGWTEFTLVKDVVLRKIIQRFRGEEIEFAFPSTSVYMAKV